MREIICFHKPDEENGYLSNWHPSEFIKHGVLYTSMEQYMMCQKAKMFGDAEHERLIMLSRDPEEIKAFGRKVTGFIPPLWDGTRQAIVYDGLLEKFRQNVSLRTQLDSTGFAVLAECAVQDRVWGIGLSMDDPRRFDMQSWTGQNLLGFTLMQVRAALRGQ